MESTGQPLPPCGAMVVFAKCPIPGKSKTRLIPLVREKGSADLAQAMLSDVLVSLSTCAALQEVRKVLAYAPGDETGRREMGNILRLLHLEHEWTLEPMTSGELQESDLGAKLTHALQHTRSLVLRDEDDDSRPYKRRGAVMFLGMDSPELPMDEIVTALSHPHMAHLCPANDGGYGMLCVPPGAPESVFQNVRWSDPLTALSQLKALTDVHVPVKLGRLMHDVDEPDDVKRLAERLQSSHKRSETVDVLHRNSLGLQHHTSTCPFTTEALKKLGLIET